MDANVLFRQLGGNRFRAMTGAKDFMKDGNSLRMKIMKNNTGGNHLIITLNSNDLYDMRFESHRLNRKTHELTIKVKAEETNIPASNLQRVFTELSGLYTHMAEQSGVEGDPHDVKNFDKWCQTCGSYDKNPTLPEGYCDDCICVSCNETSSSGPSYAYCEICYEQENPDDTDYDKSGYYAEQSFNAPKPRLSKKQQETLDYIKEATMRTGNAYITGETYNMRVIRNLFDKKLIEFHPEDEQHKYNWKKPSRVIENDGVYFVVPTRLGNEYGYKFPYGNYQYGSMEEWLDNQEPVFDGTTQTLDEVLDELFGAENKGNILVYQGYRDTIDTFIGRFNTLEEAENHIYNTWMEDAHDTIQEFRSRRDGTFVSPFLADLLKDRKRKGQDWSEADKEMIKSIKLRDATFTDENKETLKYYEDNIDKWVNEWKILSQTPKGSIQQSGAWLYTANTEPPMYQGYSQRYQDGNGNYPYIILDPAFNPDSHGAESFNADELEFTDWANQETKHHGKTSLKGWADHEIKKHGANMPFDEWAKHEDKSHIKRYGAESFSAEDSGFNPVVLCKTCGYETTIMGWPRGKNKYTCSCEKWGDNDIVVICKSCNKETTYRGYEYGYCGCSRSKNAESFNAENRDGKDIKSAIKKLETALGKSDGAKYKMHDLDDRAEPTTIVGFEMSRDGEKYAGGSYLIMTDGSIVNAAMTNADYGNISDTVEEMLIKIKNSVSRPNYLRAESFNAETKSLPYKWIAGAIALGISLPYISSLLNSGRKK